MMANCWILKTEPSTYGYDDLAREPVAVWDGVRNAVAIKNLGRMATGDRLLIYHTGEEKAVVGRATVVKPAYPDPKANDAKLLVVDVSAQGKLERPVTLAQIRQEPSFADLALVRMPRLSVVPCSEPQYTKVLELGATRT